MAIEEDEYQDSDGDEDFEAGGSEDEEELEEEQEPEQRKKPGKKRKGAQFFEEEADEVGFRCNHADSIRWVTRYADECSIRFTTDFCFECRMMMMKRRRVGPGNAPRPADSLMTLQQWTVMRRKRRQT
jgi:hypothetical protein